MIKYILILSLLLAGQQSGKLPDAKEPSILSCKEAGSADRELLLKPFIFIFEE
jgi:hypothetical protein